MRGWLIAATLAATPVHAETPGAALFLHGEGAKVAISGSVSLPATRFSCAGCHGADGAGRTEGGTVFPPIRWSTLNLSGYDDQALIRALTEGLAPDGRALSRSMPRFRATDEVFMALTDHLRTLDAADGVTATEIRVRPSGDAELDVGFAAAIAVFNDEGGAFGRKVVMTEGNDAGLDLAAFARDQAKRMETACLAAALAAIREDGYQTVSLSGVANGDVLYRLRAAGLTADPAGQAVLHVGTENATTGPELPHFGCIDQLGPLAERLVREGARVTLAVPDRQALGWAASSKRTAREMHGYVLGNIIGRAALATGRNLTLAVLTESAGILPTATELVRLPR
ncbi:MAG: hypothetical protein WBB85_09060 [Albidovulum sp.]|uniref:c-type cytochrome n=1 Tax=Albidovulum sp. TaxID=1872424 RepID=UPI003CC493A8